MIYEVFRQFYGRAIGLHKETSEIDYFSGIVYRWKFFNVYDLDYITGEFWGYYAAVTTYAEHKRIVRHCNSNWFVLSDKNLILWESESFLTALSVYVRGYLMMCYVRIKRFFVTDRLICADNVDMEMYLLRGAINAAKWLGCEFWEMEDKRLFLPDSSNYQYDN